MKFFLWYTLTLFTTQVALGNDFNKKTIRAIRNVGAIKIDGLLDEEAWKTSSKAGDFIQSEPHVGEKATFDSEISILYDDHAIYIGAVLYDKDPKKILKELSIRDNLANADNFTVFFDPYNSGLNGFLFAVTASGVQLDANVSNNQEDFAWNAIWDSEITFHEDNWTVEIKIPLSSLRFQTENQQHWGLQFGREIRRFRETSNWSPIDPLINGWVQQSGKLTHLDDIKTPVRLALFPYISGYIDNFSDKSNNISETNTAYNAGMDIKYGINDAFTLDMTLIPDFGQVISDRQVLNLSPFEVFFEENRQFFTEGTELFNKGDLFYSRRIGGRPFYYWDVFNQLQPGEQIISNPDVSQLYNATKISGRTNSGYGLGFFNAFIGESFAVARNTEGLERKIKSNPYTNYNALVVDKNLKNNSYVSLINTNVFRDGSAYDANATAVNYDFRNKKQTYHFGGNVSLTQKFSKAENDAGYAYYVSTGKVSGRWTYDVGQGLRSVNYNPNDMGFILSANEQYYFTEIAFQEVKPKAEKLQRWEYTFWGNYRTLYAPKSFVDVNFGIQNFYLWKSRNAVGGSVFLYPVGTRDYFEPRTGNFETYVYSPASLQMRAFFSSDYRKPVALDISIQGRKFDIEDRLNWEFSLSPRFRFSDKFSIFPQLNILYKHAEPGYVNQHFLSRPDLELSPNDVLIGVRNRLIIENTFNIRYIFNNKVGINTRLRHYYDNVQNQHYGRLNTSGNVDRIDFDGKDADGNHVFDRNINIFNVDLQLNWRFLPGSDIIFVWKNQIFTAGQREEIDYFKNVGSLIEQPQFNSFSLRVLFFVDYLYLNKVKRG